jgi:hypothetical protein
LLLERIKEEREKKKLRFIEKQLKREGKQAEQPNPPILSDA